MQPGLPPPLASMGVEGVGSTSGVLAVIEKRVAKKSIGVWLVERMCAFVVRCD